MVKYWNTQKLERETIKNCIKKLKPEDILIIHLNGKFKIVEKQKKNWPTDKYKHYIDDINDMLVDEWYLTPGAFNTYDLFITDKLTEVLIMAEEDLWYDTHNTCLAYIPVREKKKRGRPKRPNDITNEEEENDDIC